MFIKIVRVLLWRTLIAAGAAVLAAGMVYYHPELVTSALKSADGLAQKGADLFEGHPGILATLLAEGYPIVMMGAIAISGIVAAAMSMQWAVWKAMAMMLFMPLVARALKIILAMFEWNDWLIEAGRSFNDSLPSKVRSWGSEVGLEQNLQLLILIAIIIMALSTTRICVSGVIMALGWWKSRTKEVGPK